MMLLGLLIYFACPYIMAYLTPVIAVRKLAVKSLRAVLYAEGFYGASIVAVGALRGAGDTLIPSVISMASIWGVRISLAALLVRDYGLVGVWTAMAIELIVRGLIFILRLGSKGWVNRLAADPGA